jgi:hypothetical protein
VRNLADSGTRFNRAASASRAHNKQPYTQEQKPES